MHYKFLIILASFILLASNIVIAQDETILTPGDVALDGLLDTGPTTTPETDAPTTTSYPNLPKKLPKTGAEA